MKYSKHLLSIAVIVFIAALTLLADDQQNISELGSNKLVYKVKYIQGYDLAKLLDEYIDKSLGMKVDYIQGINTIIITAPKDSHPILLKLIEEFDKKPLEVDLNIYIVSSFPKKNESQRTSKTYTFLGEDFNKKLETLNSMNPEVKYEGYGQLTIPLTTRKTDANASWSFSFAKDSVTYILKIDIHEMSVINNIIILRDFNVGLINEKGKYESLFRHSFDIDATSNKLTITGTSRIFGKNSSEKLEIVFWPKIIKD